MDQTFTFCCLLALVVGSTTALNPQQEQELLKKLLPTGYNKHVRPTNQYNASGSTFVNINLFVRHMKMDAENMKLEVQLTFRERWNDNRLSFNVPVNGEDVPYVTLTDVNSIWKPDLFFTNELEGHDHNLMAPNEYIRVSPNGDILYSARISLTLSCPMNLRNYPFDTQICSLRMASYGYTTKDITFEYKEVEPVQVTKELSLDMFALQEFQTNFCNSVTNTGEYSCLKIDFHLKREFKYFLIMIYIPCMMLVILSWTSFWLGKNVTARTLVGLSSLLVMTIQVSSLNENIPKSSYTKAIDVWTGVCLTFAFAAFLEFCTVNYFGEREQPGGRFERQPRQDGGNDEGGNNGDAVKKDGTLKSLSKAYMDQFNTISQSIDGASQVLFPLAFLAFMVIYWIAY